MVAEHLIVTEYPNVDLQGGLRVPDDLRGVLEKYLAEGYHVLDAVSFEGDDRVPNPDVRLSEAGLNPDPGIAEELIRIRAEGMTEWIGKLTSGQLTGPYADNILDLAEKRHRHQSVGDDHFRVVTPLTGGMDSTTLYVMARDCGYPTDPIYMDMGQPYAKAEIEVAGNLAEKYGQELDVISMDVDFKLFGDIMLGRNAAIIFQLAERMRQKGQWGEMWFGNLAGESPITGGDKSRRFMNDTQHLLSLLGYDMRLMSPLIGMDKPDEVVYMQDRDPEALINTKSCFDPTELQCGGCPACFRKWVAYTINGIDINHLSPEGVDIREAVEPAARRYHLNMSIAERNKDYSHYTPARIRTTLGAIATLGLDFSDES